MVAAASLSLSSPNSLLGLRIPPPPFPSPPRRLRLRLLPRASASASASAPAPAAAATLYEVLEIRAGATGREIKAAYRRLARERHPDVVRGGGGGGGGASSSSADEFIRIHAAYATLSDPDLRARYDRAVALAAVAAAAVAQPQHRWPPRASSPPPSFARSGRRTWETDQCW